MRSTDPARYPYPIPADDELRLESLESCRVVELPPQPSLHMLTQLAATVFNVPVALISLMHAERQAMLATFGTEVTEMPRSTSFCAHALMQDDILFVANAAEDERFADNPLVTGQPHIRFYAGMPLLNKYRYKIGTFCLIDHMPRHELTRRERRMLEDFATITSEILNV